MNNIKQNEKLYNIIRSLCIGISKILFKSKIEGIENIPEEGPVMLCSNHISNWDPILLIAHQKRKIFYMAKEELFKNRLLNKFLRAIGTFPVSRGKGDKSALNNSIEIIKKGEVLGIFIEGTRSKNGEFLKPKSGAGFIAYESKCNVLPVCITYNKNKKIRKEVIISFGETIKFEDIGFTDGNGKEIRNASKMIMGNIIKLRK